MLHISIRCLLIILAFAATTSAEAGFLPNNGELDQSFDPSGTTPGRVPVAFDVSGSAFTDYGINAVMDDAGRITTVARVDINNVDQNLIGIGLARHSFTGVLDTSFQTGGKRVREPGITAIADACFDTSGKIVVAGMAPGANGSAGAKDLALARFNADGSDDLSFSSDGFNTYSRGDATTERDEAITDIECLPDGSVVILGWYYADTSPDKRIALLMHIASNGNLLPPGFSVLVPGNDSAYAAGHWDVDRLIYALNSTGSTGIGFFTINNGAVAIQPGAPTFSFATYCPSLNLPTVVGIALVSPSRYVASLFYVDTGNVTRHALANINAGATPSMSCQTVDFGGAGNAGITPPAVILERIYVGLGFQPFGSGALPSRVRAYVVLPDGSFVTDQNFGVGGMAQWYFNSSNSSPSDNRSFIQNITTRFGYLHTVGSRGYNGLDVDAALSRLGGTGIFRHGFEDTPPP